MTPAPMCISCVHFDNAVIETPVCAAFPDGIPTGIFWDARIDHRKPYPNDGGIRFEQDTGFPAVDFAFYDFTSQPPGASVDR